MSESATVQSNFDICASSFVSLNIFAFKKKYSYLSITKECNYFRDEYMKIWGEQSTAEKKERKKETYNLLSGWFSALLIHSIVKRICFL